MAFRAVDADTNGLLSGPEFRALARHTRTRDAEKLLNAADPHGAGQITFSDAVRIFAAHTVPSAEGPVSLLERLATEDSPTL